MTDALIVKTEIVAPAAGRHDGVVLDEALLHAPERFINRELSWLAFNSRVLDESENPRHPLLERLRFLSISANNLDEFYMVRVAGLQGQVREGVVVISQDGLSPAEQLAKVLTGATDLERRQQSTWRNLKVEMGAEGLIIENPVDVTVGELDWLEPIFLNQVFPVLTPMAIDPAHPFPFIPNLAFSIALKLRRRSDVKTFYALVPVPQQVKRFWPLITETKNKKHRRFLALEDMVGLFIETLFPDCDVEAKGVFRVLRDSDVELEEEAEDLVREFEAMLRQRRLGSVVRRVRGRRHAGRASRIHRSQSSCGRPGRDA